MRRKNDREEIAYYEKGQKDTGLLHNIYFRRTLRDTRILLIKKKKNIKKRGN